MREALRGEHVLHLRGRDVRVREPDDPTRAAGVVDRELQALLAARQRRQEDEDQAGNGDQEGEGKEPVPLADNVKHARGPLLEAGGRWDGQ